MRLFEAYGLRRQLQTSLDGAIGEALPGPQRYAWHVERATFDEDPMVLLDELIFCGKSLTIRESLFSPTRCVVSCCEFTRTRYKYFTPRTRD